jgi:hypothetical protein
MDWIKRNLYFVIGSLVALALLGGAGWYFYSAWKSNTEIVDKLNEQYTRLDTLNKQNPHPGRPPHSDNIALAKQQQGQLKEIIGKARKGFQTIPSLPEGPKVAGEDFISSLRQTIDQLQKAATNNSITLPHDYSFSFAAQRQQMKFSPGSLEPLAAELGEVKALCDALFQARVNSLDYVRRERVAPEDLNGPLSDYLNQKSVTNQLAILTPYQVKFRCFTAELASVLGGISSSPYGFLIKTINVEPAPAQEIAPEPAATPVQYVPQPVPIAPPSKTADDRFRARYGMGRPGEGGGPRRPPPAAIQPVPQVVVPTVVAPVSKGGLQTVLDERQLIVTLALDIVKLLPQK